MNFDLYNSELCLAHNAPVRLMSARGVRICCTAGRVWLTVDGEAMDVPEFATTLTIKVSGGEVSVSGD